MKLISAGASGVNGLGSTSVRLDCYRESPSVFASTKSQIISMKTPRLTRCELELMDVLWQKGEATVQAVCDQLKRPLAYTTVMTTLSVLHSKKKVLKRVKRGRAHVYQPIVSRDDISRAVLSDLRSVLFADQLPQLVLGLLEDGNFSQEDVQTLKAALEKVEQQGGQS